MTLRVGFIVAALGGELHGDADRLIEGLAPLEHAHSAQLSFLSHPKYQHQLARSQAGCVIVGPPLLAPARARGDCIVSDDPYLFFARVTQLWKQHLPSAQQPRIHPSSVIDPSAQVHLSARIGALCVIEAGAQIGAD
ncbi:MAG: LpxD N-terminal domain-containing protein, partial [Rhodoferax sp.]|nr:LpxD N-terminal domain-containing protein [Rhodoferax sp.]